MKTRVNLAVRTGRGRERRRETGARVRHVPMDGARARTHTHEYLFFLSQQRDFISFRFVSFYFVIRRGIAFCYFASLCASNSQTLTHHSPSITRFGFTLSLCASKRSRKVGRLSAGSKALKMPRVSLHLKFAGNVARVYIAARRHRVGLVPTKTERNEPSQKDTPRRIIHFERDAFLLPIDLGFQGFRCKKI